MTGPHKANRPAPLTLGTGRQRSTRRDRHGAWYRRFRPSDSPMSIEAVGRALAAPLGGNQKVILLGLANHAHPDGSQAFPAMETLASYAHTDRRTAQRNIRRLEESGYVERDGIGPRGQSSWRVCFEVWEGRQNAAPGDLPRAGVDPQGGAGVEPPEPSIEPSSSQQARASELPEDFPDELRPHARRAFSILREVADHIGTRPPSARELAFTIMARPRRPVVLAAHDWAAWVVGAAPRRWPKNVVASYRNWLDNEADLAATELMPDDPAPSPPTQPRGFPQGVTPLRRNGVRPHDESDDALARLVAASPRGA